MSSRMRDWASIPGLALSGGRSLSPLDSFLTEKRGLDRGTWAAAEDSLPHHACAFLPFYLHDKLLCTLSTLKGPGQVPLCPCHVSQP